MDLMISKMEEIPIKILVSFFTKQKNIKFHLKVQNISDNQRNPEKKIKMSKISLYLISLYCKFILQNSIIFEKKTDMNVKQNRRTRYKPTKLQSPDFFLTKMPKIDIEKESFFNK